MVDKDVVCRAKQLLKMIKRFAIEIARIGGHSEQSVGMLIIFITDITTFGISSLEERQRKKMEVWSSTGKKKPGKMKEKRRNLGPAISYCVAKYMRSFFAEFPVYVLKEERLINEILSDKISSASRHSKVSFVGLDCEWVNNDNGDSSDSGFKSPVALLQIATQSECILIQVCHLKSSIPSGLKHLLENKHILKFGVGIDEDCKRLRMFGIQVCGMVDLRYLVQRCHHKSDLIKFPERIYGLSLLSLSDAIVGVKMDKSYKVRCSNWEAKQLSNRQIAYAANDAIVALQIFLSLCLEKVVSKGAVSMQRCLQRSKLGLTNDQLLLASFLSLNTHLFNQSRPDIGVNDIWKNYGSHSYICEEVTKVGFSLCQGIVDLSFKNKSSMFKKKTSSDTNLSKISDKSIPTRKTPLYHNCLLTAPDGCLLCTCDRKKAEWYVNRNLGTVVNSEPYTVQLNFDPSGRPFVDRDYYMTVKENKCVVCGKEDDYVKKMVVPRDYRRHFPASLKDHLSHDVLLLCVTCHRTSELHDLRLKREIAEEYSEPLGNSRSVEDPKLRKVRSAAKALMYGGESIPEQRRETLKTSVKEFLQAEEFTVEKLRELSEIGTTKENEFYMGSHGERVVAKLIENGTLRDFVKMWREHFLDSMKPKFLPNYWSIDHNLTFSTNDE